MSHSRPDRADADALLAVGLDLAELRAYEFMLANPAATMAAMVAALRMSSRRIARVLTALERKGLATRSPERSQRHLPTPPDIAIEALIAKRQDELQRARVAAERMRDTMRIESEKQRDKRVVELITGREAQASVFEQIQRGAQRELLSIERPPYVVGSASGGEVQEQAMARGVAYRNILEAEALEIPGKVEQIRRLMARGEQTRVLSGLPLKLIIVDRRVAIIPLSIERASESALLLRPSSLLDALCELFESLWQRAVPFALTTSVSPRLLDDPARASDDFARLLPLLAAGINDKAIAHQLGISDRTLHRRLADLTETLGARTRFQAGWLAALRSLGMFERTQ